MRLTLANAQPSARHPGRMRFELVPIFERDPAARYLGLRTGLVRQQERALAVVLDGTLAWIELWPAITNPRRIALPVDRPIEVREYRLGSRTDAGIRLMARRSSQESDEARGTSAGSRIELEFHPLRARGGTPEPLTVVIELSDNRGEEENRGEEPSGDDPLASESSSDGNQHSSGESDSDP